MLLVLATVVGGVLIGYARGGRLRHLADAGLKGAWLLFLAVGAQIALTAATVAGWRLDWVDVAMLLASQVAVLAFLWLNRALRGTLLAAVGVALNTLVIAVHGAMPVSEAAVSQVPGAAWPVPTGMHRPLAEGDALWWLADVIPVPLLRSVISVGDIVLAAGVALIVIHLMSGERTQHERG